MKIPMNVKIGGKGTMKGSPEGVQASEEACGRKILQELRF